MILIIFFLFAVIVIAVVWTHNCITKNCIFIVILTFIILGVSLGVTFGAQLETLSLTQHILVILMAVHQEPDPVLFLNRSCLH